MVTKDSCIICISQSILHACVFIPGNGVVHRKSYCPSKDTSRTHVIHGRVWYIREV